MYILSALFSAVRRERIFRVNLFRALARARSLDFHRLRRRCTSFSYSASSFFFFFCLPSRESVCRLWSISPRFRLSARKMINNAALLARGNNRDHRRRTVDVVVAGALSISRAYMLVLHTTRTSFPLRRNFASSFGCTYTYYIHVSFGYMSFFLKKHAIIYDASGSISGSRRNRRLA